MNDLFLVDDNISADFIFGSFCFIYAIVIFGTVPNVVNLIIFYKLGFKDTVNISLFALTICELCSLFPLVCTGVLAQPRILPPDINFQGLEVLFLASGWPHTKLMRQTYWITAFIMVERCLCIAKTLKVKSLLTPFRVKCCLVTFCIIAIAGVMPTYATHSLDWKFYPLMNRTLLGLKLTDNALEVTHVSNMWNNSVSPLMSFGITAACTVIIVVQLNRKSKWRQSVATSERVNERPASNKDSKAAKLVITLSVIFLVSVIPSTIGVIGNVIDDNFGVFGIYRNIFNICYCIIFIFESANSSIHIFIYYFMNSRFQKTFWFLFVPLTRRGFD